MTFNTSLGSTNNLLQWSVGVSLPDQCLFFSNGVLLLENAEAVISLYSSQTVNCILNWTSRSFLSKDDPPGTVTTFGIDGGLYLTDESGSVIVDFKFRESFRASQSRQQSFFSSAIALNGDGSKIRCVQFLHDQAELNPATYAVAS